MAPEQIGTGLPDGFYFAGSLATAASPKAFTYDGVKALAIYTTCASTNASTSYEPVYISNVLTGTGQVGGRVRVKMSIGAATTDSVVLGGWANAFKASVDCNTGGRCTGLLSVTCAELTLPASDVSALAGTYAVSETELVAPASCSPSAATCIWYNNVSGNSTAVTATRLALNLMKLDGMGAATSATNCFHTTGTVSATHGLRIDIDGVKYDILLKASTYA